MTKGCFRAGVYFGEQKYIRKNVKTSDFGDGRGGCGVNEGGGTEVRKRGQFQIADAENSSLPLGTRHDENMRNFACGYASKTAIMFVLCCILMRLPLRA